MQGLSSILNKAKQRIFHRNREKKKRDREGKSFNKYYLPWKYCKTWENRNTVKHTNMEIL